MYLANSLVPSFNSKYFLSAAANTFKPQKTVINETQIVNIANSPYWAAVRYRVKTGSNRNGIKAFAPLTKMYIDEFFIKLLRITSSS